MPGFFWTASNRARAVSQTSPTTGRSTRWCDPRARASSSIWTTTASGASKLPCRIVHMFKDAPKVRQRSASAMSSEARGVAKPPEMPSDHGLPEKSPFATAEVVKRAPTISPTRSSGSRARASTAPRPASIRGRRARRVTTPIRPPTCKLQTTLSRAHRTSGSRAHDWIEVELRPA